MGHVNSVRGLEDLEAQRQAAKRPEQEQPLRAPKANAIAARFVGTSRRECLDRLPILNRRHLEHVLRACIDHYNADGPHRSLNLTPPTATDRERPLAISRDVTCRNHLGRLMHEYKLRCVDRPCASPTPRRPCALRAVESNQVGDSPCQKRSEKGRLRDL